MSRLLPQLETQRLVEPLGEGLMAGFRCYLLDGSGRIVASEEIEAADSNFALVAARELLAQRQSHAFELWQGDQRLHKEERNTAGT